MRRAKAKRPTRTKTRRATAAKAAGWALVRRHAGAFRLLAAYDRRQGP